MRKTFISPYSVGYLSGLDSVSAIFENNTPDFKFRTFIYTSLLQSGSNFIQIFDHKEGVFDNKSPEFIQKRLLVSDAKKYFDIQSRVSDIFKKYTFGINDDKNIINDFNNAQLFFVDLIYSIKTGSDFIFTGYIPELSKYKEKLPLEFYQPIHNVLGSIKQDDIFVPNTIGIIDKPAVKKLNEIIESDIYLDYSESQNQLNTSFTKKIISNIKLSAEKVV
ncbi:MAG: hypothetical protein OEX81_00875, partial [Candidatus Pacebacteria bacterium]|nr:hypothetical protein [Candidatus Paceibacterota bacterium]